MLRTTGTPRLRVGLFVLAFEPVKVPEHKVCPCMKLCGTLSITGPQIRQENMGNNILLLLRRYYL